MSPEPPVMVRVTPIVPVFGLTMAQRDPWLPSWQLPCCYLPLTAANAPIELTLVDQAFDSEASTLLEPTTAIFADIVLVCYELNDLAAQKRMHRVRTCAT
jgi:hypothetical protein